MKIEVNELTGPAFICGGPKAFGGSHILER